MEGQRKNLKDSQSKGSSIRGGLFSRDEPILANSIGMGLASESATDPIFIGESTNQMKPMKLSFKPSDPKEPIEGSLSPKIIKQEPRSSGKQPSHLLYKNLDDYSAAKEY